MKKPIDKIINEDAFLLRMCESIKKVSINGNQIELLDLHIHPKGIGHSSAYHQHSFVEIHIVDSGTGRLYMNDETYIFGNID